MIGAAAGFLLGVVLAPHRSSTFKQPCLASKQQVVNARSLQPLAMANSRFQYVKKFELSDALLPDTYLVARLDGHRFTKFTAEHGFTKPNDERGLLLMAECARQVMSEWSDLVMAFGQSDEFSFLLPASSPLYGRRSAKLSTSFVSLFSSSFVFFWPKHFPDTPLLYPPNFDARIVSYPSAQHVRDYFSWRQADCHINNLYNTCFWALVADGVSKQDAQVALKGTTSGDKNELLFSRFNTNYNEIPQRFRKGTTLFRARPTAVAAPPPPPPPPPEKPSRQPSRQDGAAAVDGSGDKGGRGPPVEGSPVSATATGGETPTAGWQAGETGVEAPRLAAQETNNRAENNIGVETIPDSRPSEDGKPEAGTEGGDAQAGVAASGAATGKGQGDKRPQGRSKGGASEKAGGAPRGDAVVKVVSCSDGKGRAKRLLKKGHAPPGAIEEDACDLIRDDFWDRNPHILAAGTMRR
ncbi:unnamed protein product [Ectocarpus sp. 6 AP-2014]